MSLLQITCIASIYNLYKERVDKYIDVDQPSVFSASASQSFIDPQSHYSSYQDAYDSASNHNDAQIQGKRLKISDRALWNFSDDRIDVIVNAFKRKWQHLVLHNVNFA